MNYIPIPSSKAHGSKIYSLNRDTKSLSYPDSTNVECRFLELQIVTRFSATVSRFHFLPFLQFFHFFLLLKLAWELQIPWIYIKNYVIIECHQHTTKGDERKQKCKSLLGKWERKFVERVKWSFKSLVWNLKILH